MKASSAVRDARPRGEPEPETTVRAVEALVAIRMQARKPRLEMAVHCPLCRGHAGDFSLLLAAGQMVCMNPEAQHTTADLARLLIKAAVRKASPTSSDDPATALCLRALASRSEDA